MTGLVPIPPPSMDSTVVDGETIVFSEPGWQVEADILPGIERFDYEGVHEAINDHLAHPGE